MYIGCRCYLSGKARTTKAHASRPCKRLLFLTSRRLINQMRSKLAAFVIRTGVAVAQAPAIVRGGQRRKEGSFRGQAPQTGIARTID